MYGSCDQPTAFNGQYCYRFIVIQPKVRKLREISTHYRGCKCHFTGRNFISKSLSTFLSLLCIVQTQAMAVTIHNALPSLNALKSKSIIRNRPESRRVSANSVRCCQVATSDKQSITVSNGNDSLEICRVLNGMWQTSGGWGRIDRDDAVDAMLRYADAGLTTFDMADHCMSGKPQLLSFSGLCEMTCHLVFTYGVILPFHNNCIIIC